MIYDLRFIIYSIHVAVAKSRSKVGIGSSNHEATAKSRRKVGIILS